MQMYKIVGISGSISEDGRRFTTIHGMCDFEDYYHNPETNRFCEGKQVEKINAGSFDCSNIRVGQNVEIYYSKAIQTKNGLYQPISSIIVADK